ncbi:MAG: AMP-binding protein [Clostridia bacterium]|nr:AMP-binding protein [Clostridia bacterium]
MDSAIPRNYVEYMEHINRNFRDKTAIYEKKNGNFFGKTLGQLYDDVQTFSKKLYTLGLKGKKIAVMGKNCYEWIVTYFSVVTYVGVLVPIDETWTTYDFKNILDTVDIECIVCDEQTLDKVYPICIEKGIKTIEFRRDLEIYLSEKLSVNHIELDLDKKPEEMSVLAFTSGTSNKPKGVMLSQINLISNQYGLRQLVPYEAEDRILLVLPLWHILTFNVYMAYHLHEGISIYLTDMDNFIEDLRTVRPTSLPASPYMLEKIIKILDEKSMKRIQKDLVVSINLRKKGKDKRQKIFKDFHSIFGGKLRYISIGGTNLRENIMKFYDNVGLNVLQGYGLTECGPVITFNSYNNNILNTVGKVIYGQKVKIIEGNDSKIGEIAVKGKNVMLGYYNNDKLNEKSFTEDGYFKTGDLGYFDNTGSLHLVGRKKRLITTSSGKNIYPGEIEKMIMEFGKISKVVVYWDKTYLKVTIVTNLEEGQVIAILKDVNNKLPKYKRIKDFEIKRELR